MIMATVKLGERLDDPHTGGWSRIAHVDGVEYRVRLSRGKRVRIAYKPRESGWGYHWTGHVFGQGKELWCDRVDKSTGAKCMLERAGLLVDKELEEELKNDEIYARVILDRVDDYRPLPWLSGLRRDYLLRAGAGQRAMADVGRFGMTNLGQESVIRELEAADLLRAGRISPLGDIVLSLLVIEPADRSLRAQELLPKLTKGQRLALARMCQTSSASFSEHVSSSVARELVKHRLLQRLNRRPARWRLTLLGVECNRLQGA